MLLTFHSVLARMEIQKSLPRFNMWYMVKNIVLYRKVKDFFHNGTYKNGSKEVS